MHTRTDRPRARSERNGRPGVTSSADSYGQKYNEILDFAPSISNCVSLCVCLCEVSSQITNQLVVGNGDNNGNTAHNCLNGIIQ